MNRNQHKLDRNSYRCWSVNITTQQSVSGSDTVKTNDIHISARCLNFIHLHACHSAVSWFPSDLSLPITSWTNNSWHVNERLYSCWLRLCYPVDVAVLMSCILLSANIGFVRRETRLEREWSSAKNHFFIHFIGRVHTEKHFTHRHTTLLDADTTIRQIYLTFCFSFSVLTGQNLFPPPFVEDILRSLVRKNIQEVIKDRKIDKAKCISHQTPSKSQPHDSSSEGETQQTLVERTWPADLAGQTFNYLSEGRRVHMVALGKCFQN